MANIETAKAKLKEYFGHDGFLDGQELLVEAVLGGQDAFGIMPTGGGKSICYQLPSLLFDGVTIVISPLISLMKDQIHALSQQGISAAYINSTLSETQVIKVLDHARAGKYKIIYVAPERLESRMFCDFCKAADIPFVAIDEAHCASQWGQDFRPSYAMIKNFISGFSKRPVVAAFTATATKKVQNDVESILGLKNPKVVLNSFDRKNLSFEVRKPKKKYEELAKLLKEKSDKYGIVYCSTRKMVEEVCDRLINDGFSAAKYHAGLSDSERHSTQDDFIYDKVKIIVATNAFGMGIDKSNVAFVVHYNMPQDIESYYQEAGRAGRDGSDADCILLFGGQDLRTNLFLIENTQDRTYESDEQMKELQSKARERLKLMEGYCNTASCLRNYILSYFGEAADKPCNHCGSCNSDMEECDITILAQKILSCVAKSSERFGRNLIIDTLRGSKNEKIARFGLNRLSTYGICTESAEEIKEVCNFLVENAFLYVTNDKFPIMKLGENSSRILKDRETILLLRKKKSFDKASTHHKTAKPHPVAFDTDLFARLKSTRAEIAAEQKVPAYIVFHDAALQEMAAQKPSTLEAFSMISGVGTKKLEAYGHRFIECIKKYLDERGEHYTTCPSKPK
ncbi:MAG: DNA helicase RecQ [Firmicutes bacterium]|nr:DNA helicase RecQ [Bacillota bacterium]